MLGMPDHSQLLTLCVLVLWQNINYLLLIADTAFEAAAEAAFMTKNALSPTFNPYANDVFFLHGSFIFEVICTSAN